MQFSLGMNEALILSVLHTAKSDGPEGLSVADVSERLMEGGRDRSIDPGSIYVALRRMTDRGYVSVEKGYASTRDGRKRDIAFFSLEPDGEEKLREFARDAESLLSNSHLRPKLARHEQTLQKR